MHRRDLLLLRQPAAPRIVELSCERLHMAYLDLQTATNTPERNEELSFAEPPAMHPTQDVEEWFRDLETQLSAAEVVKIVGREWLRPDALRTRVEAILDELSRRGIRIE